MNHRKNVLIASGVAALLFSGNAIADFAAGDRLLGRQVQACVDEIGKRADYAHAGRALHEVVKLKQNNLEELRIEIETSVFFDGNSSAVRRYTTACVVGTLNEVVRFRIREETTRALATTSADGRPGRT